MTPKSWTGYIKRLIIPESGTPPDSGHLTLDALADEVLAIIWAPNGRLAPSHREVTPKKVTLNT